VRCETRLCGILVGTRAMDVLDIQTDLQPFCERCLELIYAFVSLSVYTYTEKYLNYMHVQPINVLLGTTACQLEKVTRWSHPVVRRVAKTNLVHFSRKLESIVAMLPPLTSEMFDTHSHKPASRVFKDFIANLKTSLSASYASSLCVPGSFFFNAMPTITGRRDNSESFSEAVTQIKVAA
jgi:hypothetical protein